jgi:hypothetical protein
MQQPEDLSQQEQLLTICRLLITECRKLEDDLQPFLNGNSAGSNLQTLIANQIMQIERLAATAKALSVHESYETEV